MMRSLRSRVVGGMVLLIALVFVIALLGVNAIRALDQSVDHELSLMVETTDLGNGLISSVASEVRSAEQYLVRPAEELRLRVLEQGDSAYALQRRYRGLSSLTTADRYIVNQIADNQAQVEVAYAMAHAFTDLGRPDEARRYAELARSPSDTLLRDVRALSLAHTSRSMARAADLGRQGAQVLRGEGQAGRGGAGDLLPRVEDHVEAGAKGAPGADLAPVSGAVADLLDRLGSELAAWHGVSCLVLA